MGIAADIVQHVIANHLLAETAHAKSVPSGNAVGVDLHFAAVFRQILDQIKILEHRVISLQVGNDRDITVLAQIQGPFPDDFLRRILRKFREYIPAAGHGGTKVFIQRIRHIHMSMIFTSKIQFHT